MEDFDDAILQLAPDLGEIIREGERCKALALGLDLDERIREARASIASFDQDIRATKEKLAKNEKSMKESADNFKKVEDVAPFLPEAKKKALESTRADYAAWLLLAQEEQANGHAILLNIARKRAEVEIELQTMEAERAKLPRPEATDVVLPQVSKNLNHEYELKAAKLGLKEKLQGRRIAIFGGEEGRTSARELAEFLIYVFELDDVAWYAGEEVNQLREGVRLKRYALVVYFPFCTSHAPHLMKECRRRDVPVVMCTSSGKKRVFKEIAKAFGVEVPE